MRVDLTDEQEFFRETARRFLETEAPITRVRELYENEQGFDRGWWKAAASIGWTSLFVPEQFGGGTVSGRPARDAVILAEEIGRMVSPGPFLPANLVAAALAWRGNASQQADVLPGLVAGEAFASWAHAESGSHWFVNEFATTAVVEGGQVVLAGEKAYVEAATVADHFLVTARTGDGVSLVLVPRDARGVTVHPGRSVDVTRRFGRVRFDDIRVPHGAVVGDLAGAVPTVERLLRLALVLQCAELVGMADRTLEDTIAYGRERRAFGRPIVSFQALKHRIADMATWLEGSKALFDELADALDEDRDDAPVLASAAKAYIGEHCVDIVDDCVQINGGMGVTWEHDIHLYGRRCALNRAIYGTPEEHKVRLLAAVGGDS